MSGYASYEDWLEDQVLCEECGKPLKVFVERYEFWGAPFSETHYECENPECPTCDDYEEPTFECEYCGFKSWSEEDKNSKECPDCGERG